jgi:hypothetical protein
MRFLVILLASPVFLLTEAWALMVAVGVVHGEWLPMLPTIGYGAAVKVALAITLLTAAWAAGHGFAKGVIGDE